MADPTDDFEKIAQTLQQAVASAPRFAAAWAKLLYAVAAFSIYLLSLTDKC